MITQPKPTTRDAIEALLDTDPNIRFKTAQQKLKRPMSSTYFRKVRQRWQASRNPAADKPVPAPSPNGEAQKHNKNETHSHHAATATVPTTHKNGSQSHVSPKRRAPSGTTKEMIYKLLDNTGGSITFEEAKRICNDQGILLTTKWFHTCVGHYQADKMKPPTNPAAPKNQSQFVRAVQQARSLIHLTGSKAEAIALLEIL